MYRYSNFSNIYIYYNILEIGSVGVIREFAPEQYSLAKKGNMLMI